jgi:hypothetical protein
MLTLGHRSQPGNCKWCRSSRARMQAVRSALLVCGACIIVRYIAAGAPWVTSSPPTTSPEGSRPLTALPPSSSSETIDNRARTIHGSVQSPIAGPKQAINLHERLAVHRMKVHGIICVGTKPILSIYSNASLSRHEFFVEGDYSSSMSTPFNLATVFLPRSTPGARNFNEDVSLVFCRDVIEKSTQVRSQRDQ